MKKIIFATSLFLISQDILADVKPSQELEKVWREVNNLSLMNVDPCLEAALNAQSNAFAVEYAGHQFCANSVNSGAIAISEYGGCCYVFTAIRQAQVAYIQSNFVPCPSGNGNGIPA